MTTRRNRIYAVVVTAFLIVSVTGCSEFKSQDITSPSPQVQSIPLSGAPPENPLSGFWAMGARSDQLGVYYGGGEVFRVQVPAGDHLLLYQTTFNTFYIVFRALENAILTIGLQSGDQLYEAWVYTGTISATEEVLRYEPVLLFSELGAATGWEALFTPTPGSVGTPLIGNVWAAYFPGDRLDLTFPRPGHYLIRYTSTLGTFEVEFLTTEWYETRTIDLQEGETIQEAYLIIL